MKLAMIGLGKMGGNMTKRLLRAGHAVVAYDLDEDAITQSTHDGAIPVAPWPISSSSSSLAASSG